MSLVTLHFSLESEMTSALMTKRHPDLQLLLRLTVRGVLPEDPIPEPLVYAKEKK